MGQFARKTAIRVNLLIRVHFGGTRANRICPSAAMIHSEDHSKMDKGDKVGLKQHTRQRVEYLINRHEEFNQGNITAKRLEAGDSVSNGWMPADWFEMLRKDVRDNDVYAVYSYRTIIGWVKLDGNDDWVIPPLKYSVTTTHHQSVLKYATRT